MQKIYFEGDVSQISFGVDKFEFSLGVFGYVTATAYYLNGNAKPTDSYGGNLTWVPYSPSSGQKTYQTDSAENEQKPDTSTAPENTETEQASDESQEITMPEIEGNDTQPEDNQSEPELETETAITAPAQYYTNLEAPVFKMETYTANTEGSFTASAQGLKSSSEYLLAVVRDENAEILFAPSNLLYIDQGTADKRSHIHYLHTEG